MIFISGWIYQDVTILSIHPQSQVTLPQSLKIHGETSWIFFLRPLKYSTPFTLAFVGRPLSTTAEVFLWWAHCNLHLWNTTKPWEAFSEMCKAGLHFIFTWTKWSHIDFFLIVWCHLICSMGAKLGSGKISFMNMWSQKCTDQMSSQKKREGVRRRRKSEIIDLQPNRTTKRNAERGWNTPSQEVNMAVVHAGHKSEEWLTWIHWIHWNPLWGWGRYCWKMGFWREERKRGIVRSSAFFQTVERLCMR